MTSLRFRPRGRHLLLGVVLALGIEAPPAPAQTTSPAAPAPAASPPASAPTASPSAPLAVPKPDCGERPEHPGRFAPELQQRQWRKDANAYLECYKKFAMDQRALAQQYQDAANAVIDEYNAAVKAMQAAADAAAPSN